MRPDLVLITTSAAWLLVHDSFLDCLAHDVSIAILLDASYQPKSEFIHALQGHVSKKLRSLVCIVPNPKEAVHESVLRCLPYLYHREILFITTDLAVSRVPEIFHNWSCAVPIDHSRGMFDTTHVENLFKTINQALETSQRQKASPPNVVLSLDIDETVLYLQDSLRLGVCVFNPRALLSIQHIFNQCRAKQLKIELLGVTVRLQATEPRDLPFYLHAQPVFEKFCELAGIQQKYFRKGEYIYFTQRHHASKRKKLAELYPADSSTLVFHFDDNNYWWIEKEQDPDKKIPEHLHFVLVHSGPRYALCLPDEIGQRNIDQPCALLHEEDEQPGFLRKVWKVSAQASSASTNRDTQSSAQTPEEYNITQPLLLPRSIDGNDNDIDERSSHCCCFWKTRQPFFDLHRAAISPPQTTCATM